MSEVNGDEVVSSGGNGALQDAIVWLVGAHLKGCKWVYVLAMLGDEGE